MAQKLSYRPVYGKDQPSKILTHVDQLPKIEAARRKIDTLLEELAQDVAQAGDEPLASTPESYLSAANSKLSKKKIFVPRESVLSRLLSDVNIQTIYNIALAILAWFIVGLCLQDYFDKNEVIDLSLLWWCFGKFHLVIIVWFGMFFGSFIIVPIAEGGRNGILPPIVLGVLVSLLYTAYIVIPGYFVIILQLPTASSMTVLAEAVRIAMKMHAYFRERMSSPKWPSRSNYQSIEEIQSAREAEKTSDDKKWNEKQQRNKKKESEEETAEERKQQADQTKRRHSDAVENDHDAILKGSQASRFAYFFFAPTLVYREVYPRIPRIRWEFVVRRALECVGCILYTVVIFQKYVISPELRDVKSPDFNTWRNIVLSTFNCMVPGTLAMFLGFFTLLHCWMNMMAELTQFADREFYEDWWNAPGFHAYYRKWNLVVHEWLFYYFYLDLKALGVSSLLCKMLVFVVSAIFHEIIISLTMKSFLPILAIEFICFAPLIIGISKTLSDISPQAGNLFVWINFFLGNGILMVVYSREWYMRMDMKEWPSGWQTLIPVSWAVFF